MQISRVKPGNQRELGIQEVGRGRGGGGRGKGRGEPERSQVTS